MDPGGGSGNSSEVLLLRVPVWSGLSALEGWSSLLQPGRVPRMLRQVLDGALTHRAGKCASVEQARNTLALMPAWTVWRTALGRWGLIVVDKRLESLD